MKSLALLRAGARGARVLVGDEGAAPRLVEGAEGFARPLAGLEAQGFDAACALDDGGFVVAQRAAGGAARVAWFDASGALRTSRALEAQGAAATRWSLAAAGRGDAVWLAGADGVRRLASDGAEGPCDVFTAGVLASLRGARSVRVVAAGEGSLACVYERGDGALCVGDARGQIVLAAPEREGVRLRAPALAHDGARWLAAWIREDTGKLALCVASSEAPEAPLRVAEVWSALARVDASAPALVPRGSVGGALLAWREERGPLPAVYLRALDAAGRREGAELRVSERGTRAAAVPVALAATPAGFACAWARDDGAGAWSAVLVEGAAPSA